MLITRKSMSEFDSWSGNHKLKDATYLHRWYINSKSNIKTNYETQKLRLRIFFPSKPYRRELFSKDFQHHKIHVDSSVT